MWCLGCSLAKQFDMRGRCLRLSQLLKRACLGIRRGELRRRPQSTPRLERPFRTWRSFIFGSGNTFTLPYFAIPLPPCPLRLLHHQDRWTGRHAQGNYSPHAENNDIDKSAGSFGQGHIHFEPNSTMLPNLVKLAAVLLAVLDKDTVTDL